MKTIGARVRAIRESKGMTLQQVALSSGYDAGNLSKLEKGRINWSGPAIRAIATALEVPVRNLFLTPTEIKVLELWDALGEAERSVLCRMAGVSEIETTAPKEPAAPQRRPRFQPKNLGAHAPRLGLRYFPGATPRESQ